MSDAKTKDNLTAAPTATKTVDTDKLAATAVAKSVYGAGGGQKKRNFRNGPEKREDADGLEQRIIDIARVTRVMAGGKRMRFRACVAVGDKKGNISIGMGKGADVTLAVNKAVNRAKKTMLNVPIVAGSIPHAIMHKYGAAQILLKPAPAGSGVIAGGAVRILLELTGVRDVSSKILGTSNKVTNVKCLMEALALLKRKTKVAREAKSETKEEKVEKKETKAAKTSKEKTA